MARSDVPTLMTMAARDAGRTEASAVGRSDPDATSTTRSVEGGGDVVPAADAAAAAASAAAAAIAVPPRRMVAVLGGGIGNRAWECW